MFTVVNNDGVVLEFETVEKLFAYMEELKAKQPTGKIEVTPPDSSKSWIFLW